MIINRRFLKDNFYILLIVLIFALAFFIRFHNLIHYNTYWADDGGAHIDYIKSIEQNHSLPSLKDNYLAWHEPGFYILASGWDFVGSAFGFTSINWTEFLNIIFYMIFLFIVWKFAILVSKNKWISLIVLFLFSILFIGIKLSSYINNELLNQLLILLITFLFLKWNLLSDKKYKYVVALSFLASIATLVKITSFIVIFAILLIWIVYFLFQKKSYLINYFFIFVIIVSVFNTPWFLYKHKHFGGAFGINFYEQTKQNVLYSDGWYYVFHLNPQVFYKNPYWTRELDSYAFILLSDTFSDHYNLFNNPDKMKLDINRILIANDRFSNTSFWSRSIILNQLGAIIVLIWIFGFIIFLINWFRKIFKSNKIDFYNLFLIIVLCGGWLALLYNNLRFPYLRRGVLKAHFIYFTYPIFVMLSYTFLYKWIKNKYIFFVITLLPIIVYLIMEIPLIFVK